VSNQKRALVLPSGSGGKKTSSYILRADIRILLDMSFWIFTYIYPLVNIQKAIENGHLNWIYPLKNVIFHSKLLVYQRVCTSSLQSITRIPFLSVIHPEFKRSNQRGYL